MARIRRRDKATRPSLWTPQTGLGSALKAHWSAKDHGTARMTDDGSGLISMWEDKVGAMQLTAATTARPTWSATAFNSAYPGVAFDGVANTLRGTSLGTLPTGAAAGRVYLACSVTGGATTVALLRYGGQAVQTYRGINKSGSNLLTIGDGTGVIQDTSGAVTGLQLIRGRWSGTTAYGRRNGVATTPASVSIVTLNTGTTRFALGANNAATASGFAAMTVAEVLVTDDTITDTQEQFIEEWIVREYGLANLLPIGHAGAPAPGLSEFNFTGGSFLYIPSTGQSESNGNGADETYTTSPLDPGRAQTWVGGVRPLGGAQGNADVNTALPASKIAKLVDLKEADYGPVGETHCSYAAHVLLTGLASAKGVVMTTHGIGGAGYDEFAPGTVMHTNMVEAAKRAKFVADREGRTIQDCGVLFIALEENHGDTEAEALTYLLDYHAKINGADPALSLKLALGLSSDIYVIFEQVCRYAENGAALGQLKACIDYPTKFRMVGPKYHHETAPTDYHTTGLANARRGAEIGKALKLWYGDTPGTHTGLYMNPATVSRSGTTITVPFVGAVGALVSDTSIVSDPGNNGFEWVPDDGVGIITNKAYSGTGASAQATLTLSTDSPGYLSIAWNNGGQEIDPLSGNRSTIRDSDPTTVTVNGASWPCYNRPCRQRLRVA